MSKKNKKNDDIRKKLMKNLGGNFLLWILIIIISVSVLQYVSINNNSTELTYTEFTNLYKNQSNSISQLTIEDKLIIGDCNPNCISLTQNNEFDKFTVILPELTNELVNLF